MKVFVRNKIFMLGVVAGMLFYYCTICEGVTSTNNPPKCGNSVKKRRVFLDRSYFDKNHKEHLIRDYFDDRSCEWEVSGTGMAEKYDLFWVFSPH